MANVKTGTMVTVTTKAKTLKVVTAFTVLALVLAVLPLGVAPIQAQSNSRTFAETGKTVSGTFLDYWNSHGALTQQGYPISNEMQEKSDTDGKTYTVQYFERAVFESHPENAAPNNVLLSLLGSFLDKQKYPNGAPGQQPNTSTGSVLFSQTGKRLGGIFLTYWNSHGGLAQQGYPISDEFTETSALDGKQYKVQYFERAVFEYHPENAAPYDVLLSQLGTFRYQAKYGAVSISGTPTPVSTSQSATPKIVAAANAFVATLSSTQKSSVLFAWSNTAQKQRWSNLPQGAFQRAGLMWGNLSAAQQNAWLAVMQATLSTEGYNRVMQEWNADEVLASQGGGGNLTFGKKYYWIALIGTPSETGPWQWQWGGHHVTVNATIVGANISLTPSFIGCQPCQYTDASGKTVRPLGDIEDEAFVLVNSLNATQKQTAILGSTYIDLVLGPGKDGKTIQPEGLPASQMTASQQAALLKLIGHYTGLVNDTAAAARLAEIKSTLNQTYFAWYGPTTAGSAAYFRITGPTLVIEYAPQSLGGNAANHIHGIYRDPTNDYGAKYAK